MNQYTASFLEKTSLCKRKLANSHLAQVSYIVTDQWRQSLHPSTLSGTDISENQTGQFSFPHTHSKSLSESSGYHALCPTFHLLCLSPKQLLWPLLPLQSRSEQDLFLKPITATAHSVVPLLLPLSCDYPAFSAARVELPNSSARSGHSRASQMTPTHSKERFPGSPAASLAAAPGHLPVSSFASHSLNVPLRWASPQIPPFFNLCTVVVLQPPGLSRSFTLPTFFIGVSFLQSRYLCMCLMADHFHKLECDVCKSRDFSGFTHIFFFYLWQRVSNQFTY